MAINVQHMTSPSGKEIEVKAARYADKAMNDSDGNKISDTYIKASTKVSYKDVSDSGWPTNGDNRIPDMSFIAYWNGAYSGTVSNLQYSKNGEIIGSNTIGNQSVNHANSADKLTGFINIATWGWGQLTAGNGYDQIMSYNDSSGGSLGFVDRGGQMFMQIDGDIYVQEGQQKVATESYVLSSIPVTVGDTKTIDYAS